MFLSFHPVIPFIYSVTFPNRILTQRASALYVGQNTECPTRYRTRHFFNNFTTNEDIATKFEADLPHCVRNVTTS